MVGLDMIGGFELIPALDLKGGKCVRLQEGMLSRSTEYSDDPLAMALHWQEQGARRLHLVDLDGAFSGQSSHRDLIRSIFRALEIPVQFGGGLRTLEQIDGILELGAARAILGTVAVENPGLVSEAVRRHAGAIVVGIDARAGSVALHGWVDQSTVTAVQLAQRMKDLGVERIVYTDVSRDGMLRGVNIDETEHLARAAKIPVIASGGVSGPEDVRALWVRRQAGIEGVILGRAMYEGKLDYRELATRASLWA
jgi:phosphoribosylformimino-5-aminoimidazole carboxamide ribotide isomerase